MEGFADLSKVLSSGVYVLCLRGRVVFVGRGKSILARVYAHREQRRGQARAAFLPLRPIAFDEVFIRTCRVDQLEETWTAICAEVDWAPKPDRFPLQDFNITPFVRRA